jgi:hypothetical protein
LHFHLGISSCQEQIEFITEDLYVKCINITTIYN